MFRNFYHWLNIWIIIGNQNEYSEKTIVKINKLNQKLKIFFDHYCGVLSNNVNQRWTYSIKDKNADLVKKIIRNKKVNNNKNTRIRELISYTKQQKLMILKFRIIIVNLLLILKVKTKVIKNYIFLLELNKFKRNQLKTGKKQTPELLFFSYFIINSDVENKNYMSIMTKFRKSFKPKQKVISKKHPYQNV